MSESLKKLVAQLKSIPVFGLYGAELREAWGGEDLLQIRDMVGSATEQASGEKYWPVEALFPDRVIVRVGGKLVEYPFAISNGEVQLGAARDVVRKFEPATSGDVREAVTGVSSTEILSGDFLEARSGGGFRIRVIESGLSRNRNFYSEAALRDAVDLFDGVRVFSKSDDDHLASKGKSFSNLIGGLSAPVFVESAGGKPAQIHADLTLIDADVGAKLQEAWDAGLTGLFGFSIDAGADVRVRRGGAGLVREAVKFLKVNSVDLIIEPGAGGGIVNLKEAVGGSVMNRAEIIKLLEAQGVLEVGAADALSDDDLQARLTEAVQSKSESAPEPGAVKEAAADQAAGSQNTYMTREEFRLTEARRAAAEQVRGSGLPEAAKDRLVQRLAEAAADELSNERVAEAVKDEAAYLAGFTESGKPFGLGGVKARITESQGEKTQDMLGAFFDPEHKDHRHARSFRECYVQMTGDSQVTGQTRSADSGVMREALDSGSFSAVLGDAVHRRMVGDYVRPDQYSIWRGIVDIVPVADFRDQKRSRFGGYGDMPVVAEKGEYKPVTSPSDEEAKYSVSKRGGTETITLEMIKNDDVGAIRRIPGKLAMASKRTLAKFVLDFLVTNAVVYDGLNLFHADHGNLGVATLSAEALSAGRIAMLSQTEQGSNDPLGIGPKSLLVPMGMEEAAANLFRRKDNIDQTFVQSLALNIIPVWYWTEPSDWYLVANPSEITGLEIGFLDGKEEPELLVQDNPTVGSLFTNDQITWKIRHIYGGSVLDYRAFYGARVSA